MPSIFDDIASPRKTTGSIFDDPAPTPTSAYSALGDPIPEPFRTRDLTAGQVRSYRAARTEGMRGEAELRAAGKGAEVDEALQEHPGFWGAMETATTPIFDALNIFPQAIASGAIELHRSGNAWRAFKQASADFLDNLPGDAALAVFEDKLPTPINATWADWLKEAHPDTWKNHEWWSAGAGLVLDIVTDPLTYTGVGLVSKLARGKGLIKTAEAIEKATPLTAIKGAASLPFISRPADWVAGTKLGKKLISPVYQGFGKRFIKDFEFKQLEKKHPELAESIKNALREERQMRIDMKLGKVDVKDAVEALTKNMSTGQRRLFGAMMDQPEDLKSLIRQVAGGDPDAESTMLRKMDGIIEYYNEEGIDNVKAGLLSPEAFEGRKGRYTPGLIPFTKSGKESAQELMARLGVESDELGYEIVPGIRTSFSPQIGSGTFNPAKRKTYDTIEERVLAGIPTEMDVGIQMARRGFESVRYAASRRFADAVLSDPMIARPIADVNLAKTLAKVYEFGDDAVKQLVEEVGHEAGWNTFSEAKLYLSQLSDQGYGIYRPLRGGRLEAWQLTKDEFAKKGWSGNHKALVDEALARKDPVPSRVLVASNYVDLIEKHGGEEGLDFIKRAEAVGEPIFVMPKPFIDQLNYAQKVMTNTDDLAGVLAGAKDIQDIWKAWALVSPGYHMRNIFSNIWNNLLGGVNNPASYAEAMILQGANPEKNPYLAKLAAPLKLVKGIDSIEAGGLKGQEIMESARKLGLMGTGLSADITTSVERELFRKLGDTNDALKMAEKIAPEGKGEFVRAVLETSPVPPGFVEKWITGSGGVKEFAQTQQQNPLLRLNRQVGNAAENNAKLAHFISKLREGLSPEDAAMSAKKYLFDYTDLTDFEKNVMKTVVPFYAWQRKNLVLQVQSILENPGRYSALTGKPINAIESLSEDWKDIPTPDYFAEQHAVRLPRYVSAALEAANKPLTAVTNSIMARMSPETPPIQREGIQPEFINPNLPFQDLNRMNKKDVLSSLSPILKLFPEYVPERGYSTFTDRPIEKYAGEPGQIPFIGKKGEHMLSTLFLPVGKALRMLDRAKRGQLAEQISTEIFGIKLMGVDVVAVNRGKAYQRQEKIRNLRQKYRDEGVLH